MVKYSGKLNALACTTGGTYGLTMEGLIIDVATTHADSLSERSKKMTASVDAIEWEDIQASRTGDSDAYQRLIERYQEHVAKIVWRFSRDQRVHDELVQDVFVEAYISLRGFRGTAPFSHWLSRIATRVGFHFWKAQKRDQRFSQLSLQDWDVATSNTMDEIDANDAADLLHRLLAQLPPRDRLVLTLRYIEECDVAQTAARTGWSKTMVKVQTLRAKRKLEKMFLERKTED